jgi:hypothetical protein
VFGGDAGAQAAAARCRGERVDQPPPPGGAARAGAGVQGALGVWSILTEICLCRVCSCEALEGGAARGWLCKVRWVDPEKAAEWVERAMLPPALIQAYTDLRWAKRGDDNKRRLKPGPRSDSIWG